MTEQPNKPAGAFDKDGKTRDVADRQAVKNQSSVTPEEYPEPAGATPDTLEGGAKPHQHP